MVRLAVRLPPTQCNARITPAFPLSAVTRIQPPLSLHTCIDRLSESAQNTLKDLDQASTTLGVSLKTYGSLAWEILSGEPYRHASSDLDLLAEIEDFTQLPGILQALENAASHLSFRLDGEVRFHETHAVAWRELAQRLERPTSTVLVKTNRTVFLQTVGSLLQTLKGHS